MYAPFDYSENEWAKIEQSLQCLHPDQTALHNARRCLEICANHYLLSPFEKSEIKELTRSCEKIIKQSNNLRSDLELLANYLLPSNGLLRVQNLCKELSEVPTALWFFQTLGRPKVNPRSWYQFRVLNVWTDLGGKLRISRHPIKKCVTGPLARFFSAATQPVLRSTSVETLPDVLERHGRLDAEYQKWIDERQLLRARNRLRERSVSP
jgi:hypothetical protein